MSELNEITKVTETTSDTVTLDYCDYSQYFKDITDETQLYQQLCTLVDKHLREEQEERTKIQAEFDEQTAEITQAFHASVAGPKAAADAKIEVNREKHNKLAKAIADRAMSRILKLERALEAANKKIIAKFDKVTAKEQNTYTEQTAPYKKIADEKVEIIVKKITEEIEPINEAYRNRAKELGLSSEA